MELKYGKYKEFSLWRSLLIVLNGIEMSEFTRTAPVNTALLIVLNGIEILYYYKFS